MDIMSFKIPWQYNCSNTADVELNNTIMLLKNRVISEGLEMVFNAIGSSKDDITITSKPTGELSICIDENDYFGERSSRYELPSYYNVSKAKAKFDNGLLTIVIPYKNKERDIEIDID